MESFSEAFREARINKKATLREIGEYVGKSVGYLSDIEHGRKRPPKLDIVSNIEEYLSIKDGKLLRLAAEVRRKVPKNVTQRIRMVPRLSEALLRADEDLTNEEFDNLMNYYEKIKERRIR